MKYFFCIFFIFFSFNSFSQGSFSGYMFGDIYFVQKHHNEEIEGQNGFWFRRIYFTYDYKFSEKFFTRFRLELNSSGDFKTSSNLTPYAKDAYLGIKLGKSKSFIGLSPTPTWEFIENFWGYRAVEKTPGDLYKIASSRDTGIAFKGEISPHFSYHFLLGNGEGTKSEVNKDKRAYLSLLFKKEPVFFELYTDYGEGKDETDVKVYQGFFGLKREKFTFGFQYYNFDKGQGEGKERIKTDVFSTILNIKTSEKTTILFRIDRMDDPNPLIGKQDYIPFETSTPFYLYIFGVDFSITKDIKIIPNFEFVNYDKSSGLKVENDLYFKFTFFYNFK